MTKMECNLEQCDDKVLFSEMFRATGRTTRLVDELVQEFFEKPMGTKIMVYDHYGSMQANKFLLDRFMKRLETEHPSAGCRISGRDGECILIERTTETYHERVREEYRKRQEKKHEDNIQ